MGLTQSGRVYNRRIIVISRGSSRRLKNVFTKGRFKIGSTVAIYVDDLLLFARRIDDVKTLKKKLAKYFKVKDMGAVRDMLNIHVRKRWKDIYLSEGILTYMLTILERFHWRIAT